MCGIVCYFGPDDGLRCVLEALYLLEYRAPDSSGVAVVDERGQFAIRRVVGAAGGLVAHLGHKPIYLSIQRSGSPPDLADVSARLRVGLESQRTQQVGDLNPDSLSRAFRRLGAHVAAPARLDSALQAQLTRRLATRLTGEASLTWLEAWENEVRSGQPGPAFWAAVHHLLQGSPGMTGPLPENRLDQAVELLAATLPEIVLGHGRWAMVGSVTSANAHPFPDRSRTRLVCENGSHNAPLMLAARTKQVQWWRSRGVAPEDPVHRSENTTEVIVYEWERAYHQLSEHTLSTTSAENTAGQPHVPSESDFLHRLQANGIFDPEEAALRLALWRLREGNAHACALYSRRHPGRLYVSSHHKPVVLATRTFETPGGNQQAVMVASDVNAALMLWPGAQVETAARCLEDLRRQINASSAPLPALTAEIEALLDTFQVQVVYLDQDLLGGEELLAWVEQSIVDGKGRPVIHLTRYDGTPVAFSQHVQRLDPAMVGKGDFATYTENHIAEIPEVFSGLVQAAVRDGRVRLEGRWETGRMLAPGLNLEVLAGRYGAGLERLRRLLLIGEGSSWRDAQAAAPLLRRLLPETVVTVYRPVEALNLGAAVDPSGDLAVEISWSGTTDSLLKVDTWLGQSGILRLGVTGRPQSDLGRRTAASAGVLDVRSGIEVSVATVKGYHAILATLDLLAIWLAQTRRLPVRPGQDELARLVDEFSLLLPQHLRRLVDDPERRDAIHRAAARFRGYNKVAVLGDSPAAVEAELKIEELAQIVAVHLDFHAPSLRGLIEGSAMVETDQRRTLFVINATDAESQAAAEPVITYLKDLGLEYVIHTTPHARVAAWKALPRAEIFTSPAVFSMFQPLIDVLFFFEFAVGLAYARGLTPEQIDRPRNLAKSVTTTGAERRETVEARRNQQGGLINPDLDSFTRRLPAAPSLPAPSDLSVWRAALRATIAMRPGLAQIGEPLPVPLGSRLPRHLIVLTDTEATENAALIASAAWQEILNVDLTVYRQFMEQAPQVDDQTWLLRLRRAGAVLSLQDDLTIYLPVDMNPLQWELLGAYFLIGLAVRAGRQSGRLAPAAAVLWEQALTHLPSPVSDTLSSTALSGALMRTLGPYLAAGYDKVQVIGGGMDFASASSIARTLRARGVMAESLYTDSAWHGPLATVGGADAEHDTLIVILATDPLFQAAALVDTQVYRTRLAPVLLVVPQGNAARQAVLGVDPLAAIEVPAVPRAFTGLIGAAFGETLARVMASGLEGL